MEIAVIGLGCRYPGANSPAELLENILAGRRQFREIPPERWRIDDYYDPARSAPDRTYSKQAALIDGFEFNPAAFKIPQSTYRVTDTAQWLALAVAKDALDDCGIEDLPRATTAVILGNTLTGETSRANLVRFRWPYVRRVFAELLDGFGMSAPQKQQILEAVEARYKQPFPPVNEDNLAGSLANTIAGRICNYFDFLGGGFTVDGACSSSLLAVQEACVGLERGQFDLALAGGVDVSLDPFELVGFAKVGALSDTDIRVYDQRANGFLPGEGCGIAVLQRLEDAERSRRRIYAVIRGVGCSSDGKGGITAPSVVGQSLALDRAYKRAGYSFADVDLIEGHGTGTPVGDRTELQTFIEAKIRHGAQATHRCGLGSVKSIIGHTKAAAGIAGLMKATLATYHGVLPPTMGLTVPHGLFESTAHVYPLIRGQRWSGDRPLRAAVTSAGFGGINTHVTLERLGTGANAIERGPDIDLLLQSQQDAEIFFFSADDVVSLNIQIAQIAETAARMSRAELVDLAARCAHRVRPGELRLAVVADTPQTLGERLAEARLRLGESVQLTGEAQRFKITEGIYLHRPRGVPRVAFMFPGQGSQRLNMGQRWRDRFAFIEQHWRDCDAAVEPVLRQRLSELVYRNEYWAESAKRPGWSAELRNTRVAQPAIVAASMATAEVLSYMGVEPQLVVGHSLGEYTALWCAGVLQKKQALELAAGRGSAMALAGDELEGGMVSVGAAAEEVSRLLQGIDGYATIANFNAPLQTVVSGEMRAIEVLAAVCSKRGYAYTVLDVSGAFHSRMMESARRRMALALGAIQFGTPQRLIASTISGGLLDAASPLSELLAQQIVSPVRFVEAMRAAQRENIDVFIEVGPGTVLSGLARKLLGNGILTNTSQVFATDGGSDLEWSGWCNCIAFLYSHGAPIDPRKVFERRFYRSLTPPYTPRFIGSPCEAPTRPLELSASVRAGFMSAGADWPTDEAVPAPQFPAATPAVAGDAAPTSGAILAFVQGFIAQRFGYPVEMVEPQTRLAEDLGLDSIKSAEVVAEALGYAGLHTDPTRFTMLSVGEMAAEMARFREDGTAQPETSPREQILGGESWVRAFEVQMHLRALTGEPRALSGTQVLLIDADNSPITAALLRQFEALGLGCTVHSSRFAPLPEIRGALAGCVVVCPIDDDRPPGGLEEHDLETRVLALPRFLLAAAKAAIGVIRLGHSSGGFFVLVTQSDGLGGRGDSLTAWRQAPAAAAFAKSFHLEYPSIPTRILDFDTRLTPEVVAERVLDELMCGDVFQEAGYTMSNLRFVPLLAPVPRASLDIIGSHPSDTDVVLATGGAKGVTARCVEALAAGSNARWALVGSSPAPSPGDDSEISRTLALLASKGKTAKYYQCDITRHRDVAHCVEAVVRDLGPVTGVLHGAGLNVPRRLEQVGLEQFEKILRPKMLGLLHVIRALDMTRIRHVTLLSSVIANSGMTGNADYAFANAWATQLLRQIEDMNPHVVCRAFAFSIWAQIGMGARLNSVDALGRLGVQAIEPDEGARWFADLMQRMWPSVELIVSGRMAGLPTLKFLSGQAPRSRWLDNTPLFQPGVEVIAEVLLTLDSDPYLSDHNYDGALLFPAAVAMEAMAQVAAACVETLDVADLQLRLEGLRFDRPVVVPPAGRRIRIHAFAEEPTADGSVRVRVAVQAEVAGFRDECFSGVCVWGAAPTTWESSGPAIGQPLPFDPKERLYGSIYFQGPTFQHIEAYYELSARHCIARVGVSQQAALAVNAGPLILDSWETRDCFLHSIQVCVPQKRLLPLSIESLETRGFPRGQVYMSARERLQEDRDYVYDIEVFDEAGRLVEYILGYRCRVVDRYSNEEVLEYIRALHELARLAGGTGRTSVEELPEPDRAVF
jgi:enediyne polyketide synthase